MTFADLLVTFKREVLADLDVSDLFSDAELFDFLWNASVEIAAVFGFPQDTDVFVLPVTGEVDLSSAGVFAVQVGQVVADGGVLRESSLSGVLNARRRGVGLPSLYYFNVRDPGVLRVGPVPAGVSSVIVEFTRGLGVKPGSVGLVEPWEGLFSSFHYLIPLLAGDRAWRAQGDAESGLYFWERFRAAALSFASLLGIPAEPVLGELRARGDVVGGGVVSGE